MIFALGRGFGEGAGLQNPVTGLNEVPGQKRRRPDGFPAQAGLALLLLGRRTAWAMLLRRRLARPAWARKQHPSELSDRLYGETVR